MRLIDSSDPDAVPRDQLLHHLLERAVLTSQVCRELHRSDGDYDDRRPKVALDILARWMIKQYELAPDRDVVFDTYLAEFPETDDTRALLSELRLGSLVCRDLAMLWTADTQGEYRSDMEILGDSVQKFVAAYP
ncbi:hypothetical protein [Rhodococcoides fascians]|uniref:hypothetical protein n=1 Tax=Rhodococcoides fascians TaxID=1828 RepID=UPI00056312D5|nr:MULTISPECIES: hypothetical protein [Rhodococcus]OZE97447.1 hypothetical protein CH301_17950 [Rhodococcus sp. 15-1189-1-1a]OZF12141.1 hypothetical protein CH299_18645 [Rhodococcus sp. 14-2686-1-2]